MYKTSVVLLWLVLGAVIPSILASSSSAWTVSTGSTACSGAFTVSNVAYTCDDTQQCGFGSTVKITGYRTYGRDRVLHVCDIMNAHLFWF
jgi:hypothetical protein